MYAVIFTAKIRHLDAQYLAMAQSLRELAFSQYGCQEFRSLTEGDMEIAVSYWTTLESIQHWKKDLAHLQAQCLGQKKWYEWYQVDITKIEHSYTHPSKQ